MSAHCCGHHPEDLGGDPLRQAVYRRVLWWALAINAAMFSVEIGAGLAAGSAALQADAVDFLGDAANYAISLFVVGMALRYRATAALAKGATMALFGALGARLLRGMPSSARSRTPSPWAVSELPRLSLMPPPSACCGSTTRDDANMRSAWICTRNDVLGNLAVLIAARAASSGRAQDGPT